MKFKHSFFFLLALAMSSCATVFVGTTETVQIDSYPQGATVLVDGRDQGATPTVVAIHRNVEDLLDGGKSVELELDGYKTEAHVVEATLNPVSIINLLNPLFWGIDAATGAITDYDDYSKFELKPNEAFDKTTPKTTEDTDKYSQLRALKKLLDDGVITQEEFDIEKKKILNAENN